MKSHILSLISSMFVLTVITVTAAVTMGANACPEAISGTVFCLGRGLTAIPSGLPESAVTV